MLLGVFGCRLKASHLRRTRHLRISLYQYSRLCDTISLYSKNIESRHIEKRANYFNLPIPVFDPYTICTWAEYLKFLVQDDGNAVLEEQFPSFRLAHC